MNKLQTFTNEKFGNVRTLEQNSEIWFVAIDVCRALEINNPSQALKRLDDDERTTTIILNEGAVTGTSQISLVNEPGLYGLC